MHTHSHVHTHHDKLSLQDLSYIKYVFLKTSEIFAVKYLNASLLIFCFR